MNELQLWKIFVPRGFSMSHHYAWDDFVIKTAGGLTLRETGQGKWRSQEKEGFIEVDVACDRMQLLTILEFTAKHYQQEAIMCYKISDEVVIHVRTHNELSENARNTTDPF